MIAHAIEALWTTGRLARTVLLLSRQLDHANERVAELEAQIRDWQSLSGEDDALPDIADAGEAPIPLVLTDSAREADIQRDRADALQRALQVCEVELQQTRAQLRQTEAAAGAHLRTIERLQAQIDEAHRAVHRPISLPPPVLQAPGVLAAEPLTESERREVVLHGLEQECQCGHDLAMHERDGCTAIEVEPDAICMCAGFCAADDIAPETKPSERTTTTREEPRP